MQPRMFLVQDSGKKGNKKYELHSRPSPLVVCRQRIMHAQQVLAKDGGTPGHIKCRLTQRCNLSSSLS